MQLNDSPEVGVIDTLFEYWMGGWLNIGWGGVVGVECWMGGWGGGGWC